VHPALQTQDLLGFRSASSLSSRREMSIEDAGP